jgi:hypothetical protein
MKKATFAPMYVAIFPQLSRIAQEHGYALAAHGSVNTDFDLIAIPWIEKASEPKDFVKDIAAYLKVLEGTFGTGIDCGPIGDKPHGRIAWKLHLSCGAAIDLSVMPMVKKNE